MRVILSLLWCLCLLCACHTGKTGRDAGMSEPVFYQRPDIPSILLDSSKVVQANYLSTRFWNNLNPKDSLALADTAYLAEPFVEYINMLSILPDSDVYQSVECLFNRFIQKDSVLFARFTGFFELLLYAHESDFRNEEMYAQVLRCIIHSPYIADMYKERYRFQLEMVEKNRPNTPASDFLYTTDNGVKQRMYDLESPYTLLFFNRPDCEACTRAKEYLATMEILSLLPIKVLAIFPDDDLTEWRTASYPANFINGYDDGCIITKKKLYNVENIPSFYLLDREKRVILKDADANTLENALWDLYEPQ